MSDLKSYVYPSELLKNDNRLARSIIFMPISAVERASFLDNTSNQSGKAQCLIVLPTPSELSDSSSHSWSASTVFDAISQGVSSMTGMVKPLKFVGDVLSGGAKAVTNITSSSAYGYLSVMTGSRKKMINPGYFQNYTGSALRSFSFDYKFQPRTREEAITVLNIITMFKKYASPKFSQTYSDDSDGDSNTLGLQGGDTQGILSSVGKTISSAKANGTKYWMKQPCYWKITFGNTYLNSMLKLNNLVLTDVSVTYGENVETFKDGMPKSFTLSLKMSEIDIKGESDYSAVSNNNDTSSTTNNSDFGYDSNTLNSSASDYSSDSTTSIADTVRSKVIK